MANNLGAYSPIFFAQEGLIQLEKALGMAGRVHRGYDQERRSFGKGQTISIKRPSTFTAVDAGAAAQSVATDYVDVSLGYWKEVKFELTDRELAFTGEQIITDHIRPAAYALADDIDQRLCALALNVPWTVDLASPVTIAEVTNVWQAMFDHGVPMGDPNALHYMVNGKVTNGFLQLPAFNTANGAGQAGIETQMRGTLGNKFGLEVFSNQNVKTHTTGAAADAVGATVGAGAVGDVTLSVDGVTALSTYKKGDTFTIAGDTQKYVITADKAADAGGAMVLDIYPKLQVATIAGTVVTINVGAAPVTTSQNLAFHRNAFAFVSAPLSEIGNQLGARIATITDPKSALSIRSRMWYDGDASTVRVALDILYGFTTLDGNLAVRGKAAV